MNIRELQRWFKVHVKIDGKDFPSLDDEQAAVVLDEHQNNLVVARAGSGKTTTLIAKIIYLVAVKKIAPSHIVMLCFNNQPAHECDRKLSTITVDGQHILGNARLARTFDSLADAAIEHGKILYDDKQNNLYHQTEFINEIVKKKIGIHDIYNFVRDDSREPNLANYDSEQEYYEAVRSFRYRTLSGGFVRSHGEKIIADYLFEHDISYYYESREYHPWGYKAYAKDEESQEKLQALQQKYIPDFVLQDYDIVWEHWGITGEETPEEIAEINKSGIIGDYHTYLANMNNKKWFYGKTWLDLDKVQQKLNEHRAPDDPEAEELAKEQKKLEKLLRLKPVYTNYQKCTAREAYELNLDFLMEQNQVPHALLGEEQLLKKFAHHTNNVGDFSKNIRQFVQRAEQQFPGDYTKLEQACWQVKEHQARLFYDAALKVYDEYISELTKSPALGYRGIIDDSPFGAYEYATDYKLLMNDATKAILNHRECPNFRNFIDGVEYILLDEYQDFSLLFNNFIQAIKKRAPSVKVVAVGDNCQAINGYMGASLEFFDHFQDYFPEDANRMYLHTNYRSTLDIINTANLYMGRALGESEYSAVSPQNQNKQTIDPLNFCALSEVKRIHKKQGNKTCNHQRLELVLAEILSDNSSGSVLILNRTNDYKFENYSSPVANREFDEAFRKRYSKQIPVEKLKSSTIHGAKGLESDVVVIFNPYILIHPDNYLFEVFGVTEQKVLDEERRLFYVGITRAKDKLFIINRDPYSPNSHPERDLLALLGIDTFCTYKKKSFESLRDRILSNDDGEPYAFNAVKIVIRDNHDAKHLNSRQIIAWDRNDNRVADDRAYYNEQKRGDLYAAARNCSMEQPVKLYGKPFRRNERTRRSYRAPIIQLSCKNPS